MIDADGEVPVYWSTKQLHATNAYHNNIKIVLHKGRIPQIQIFALLSSSDKQDTNPQYQSIWLWKQFKWLLNYEHIPLSYQPIMARPPVFNQCYSPSDCLVSNTMHLTNICIITININIKLQINKTQYSEATRQTRTETTCKAVNNGQCNGPTRYIFVSVLYASTRIDRMPSSWRDGLKDIQRACDSISQLVQSITYNSNKWFKYKTPNVTVMLQASETPVQVSSSRILH